jgi:hypothetical protein
MELLDLLMYRFDGEALGARDFWDGDVGAGVGMLYAG